MNCCSHCEATEQIFNLKSAQRSIKKYRKKGPLKTTKLLLEKIIESGITNADLLDIGGGIGIIHHELLNEAVSTATHVDASVAHNTIAKEEDELRDQSHLVSYLQGDAVDLEDQLPDADIVTLDKVICCYPDWEGLLRVSASKSRKMFVFSIPREKWFVRAVVRFENLIQKIKGSAFRVFVHPLEPMDEILKDMELEFVSRSQNLSWQVVVYQRVE